MPGPPPPPPPMAPAAPPPPAFVPPKGSTDRGALLKSIQKGTKLKKTVTNDKSAPMLGGRSTSNNNNNNSVNSNVISPMKNHSSIQMELKKQLANDNRNRGPPPPAPNRVIPAESNGLRQNPLINGISLSQINLRPVNFNSPRGAPQMNPNSLHRKAKSNANLSSIEMHDDLTDSAPTMKSSFSSGKPNLAPKPPVLNGKPAPPNQMKLNKPVSRTHSLKSPRSPSPESNDANIKFGTVRHMSSLLGQTLANSSPHNSRSRPALNVRPSAPPPSVPPQHIPSSPSQQAPPPPPTKAVAPVKHPNHAPPPPPVIIPQAPNHAPPPPPPHKALPAPPPPSVATTPFKQNTISNSNNSNPPPPPPRHSSMRDVSSVPIDLEEKFKDLFQSPNRFPNPPTFRNVLKIYSSKQGQLKPGYIV